MKTAIVFYSRHHGNTKKLLDAIAEKYPVTLIDATKKLKFLVALRPGVTTPALAARMAATFDRLSNGRVL